MRIHTGGFEQILQFNGWIGKRPFHETTKRRRILESGIENVIQHKGITKIPDMRRERLTADREAKLPEIQYREHGNRSSVPLTERMNLP